MSVNDACIITAGILLIIGAFVTDPKISLLFVVFSTPFIFVGIKTPKR